MIADDVVVGRRYRDDDHQPVAKMDSPMWFGAPVREGMRAPAIPIPSRAVANPLAQLSAANLGATALGGLMGQGNDRDIQSRVGQLLRRLTASGMAPADARRAVLRLIYANNLQGALL